MLPKLKDYYEKHRKLFHWIFVVYITISSITGSIYIFTELQNLKKSLSDLRVNQDEISSFQQNFGENFAEELFDDHLLISQFQSALEAKTLIEGELENLKTLQSTQAFFQVNEVYKLYDDLLNKIKRNNEVKLETAEETTKSAEWGGRILNKDYENVKDEIENSIETLDTGYQKYLVSLPPPPPPSPAQAATGYSYQTVKNGRGTFGVYLIKIPLSQVRVKTVTANKETCKDNCPTKSLADYVKENNGYAGMNGTYFCPPDYDSCKGKVNSYDYAVYNSNLGKWLSKSSLGWSMTGLATFNGTTPNFYKKSTDYGGGGVTAGIVNYPTLVHKGEVVVSSGDLTSFQKDIKGLRGAIGAGGSNLYLAIITRANVIDAAHVMRDLGAQNALNLDGGGSSAMYINGSYAVGPGRSLPNAVVLTR
ncbi:hypothetical protein A3F07_01725 [candidate division WWE3 bacterium RIFCSPHIGHO2_12_FULL_38_15]|uniref:Phosphodiester glycosidase domain-containing protein n=1 Tax=candidate division WWE3 bacterium RIFCSPHIGHO2_02_FULL_38_14 TaxID=1802620 RepID=A0A1F4V8S6_UNCKA|nr:MAG: hypothetical protein A2793_01575 [candidate division WWE3 bacterium RIFCSPHIGHO2_01_FULL_38_45]OGC48423.1 MAG: hypothetical protein A3F07_01725 [candidate division WWE3 bacterium RIFCSPHIGHO2_12_FULL_38_15]OGC53602.1 MAG: hypothetical protein A3D91_04130 [candidate division WWE3 bacterium RIFCSPHIGHO2_02_FULL_38_14]OGC54356.1 MAG: hypothetical protein A3B64_02520 [candidate division WWE3 bacterium RIFCSPLOWO2_01_FULL_37_24]HLB51601.1 phosphodiester glycosidase family protein [Patescibac